METSLTDEDNERDDERGFDFDGDGETRSNWTKHEPIGNGQISEVYRATYSNKGNEVELSAKQIKQFYISKTLSVEEDVTLRKLSQDNLLKYFGFCKSFITYSFFNEWFKGESLERYIDKNGPLSEDATKDLARQILEGVDYLHNKKVVHRNLKSSNILVDEKMKIKISDIYISKCEKFTEYKKTWRFSAPETFNGQFLPSSDIWSIGCIVVHMFTGHIPFYNLKEHNELMELERKSISLIKNLKKEKRIPNILKNFILFTMSENFKDRPTAAVLLNDDAFISGRYISKDIPKFWKKGKCIGAGGYGSVFLIVDNSHEEEPKFVVKRINRSENDKNLCKREPEILLTLERHERIVPFYGFFENNDYISIFLGYMEMGSLAKYYKDKGPLSEKKCQSFTRQILEGLVFLHSKCIIHRDIKGLNILLETEDKIRLTDFGISKFLGTATKTFTKNLGSERWVAPEILNSTHNDESHGLKVDICLGCTVVEMITGRDPYAGVTDVRSKVCNGEPPEYPDGISEKLKQFLNETFVKDPDKRKSSKDLLEASFIKIEETSSVMHSSSKKRSNKVTGDVEFPDSSLHSSFHYCKKNRDHNEFIPVSAFKIKHLPNGYQDIDLFQFINIVAYMTVRLAIQMISPYRPEFYPGGNIPFPFYTMMNKTMLRTASGMIQEVVKYVSGANDNTKGLNYQFCPCNKCKQSKTPNNVWAEVIIVTTAYILFDDIEASKTSVRLFYDTVDSSLVSLENCRIVECDVEKDYCRFVCVTCDAKLIDNLQEVLKSFESLRFKVHNKYEATRDVDKMTFIVSHPHGCTKQISIGRWLNQFPVSDAFELSHNKTWSKFTYTTCTCPGSAGAHVHILGYSGRVWHYPHLHSGTFFAQLNYSNLGFVA